jgi:hypothetical protein
LVRLADADPFARVIGAAAGMAIPEPAESDTFPVGTAEPELAATATLIATAEP